ncbi:MAG TPA: hypothetical protein VNN17_08690 [Terriglobia bacterium]|nr:hypothetical protein [Terriglobia bacterium]
MRGSITDLLIGDLFTDRVDHLWGPIESLYEPGRPPIPPWDAPSLPEADGNKQTELSLPEGWKP